MGFLVDTCIWVDVERGRLSPADVARVTGHEPVFISPVTIAELQFGVEMAKDPGIRQARQKSVDLLKRKPLLKIDEETGAIYGRLAVELHRTGKQADTRVMDLWLASQAIQFNLTVLTHNIRHFQDVVGLAVAQVV